MIAIDTNVLVRVLIDDPTAPDQCQAARRLLAGQDKVRISLVVFVEALWVMARSYRIRRERIDSTARALLRHPSLEIEKRGTLEHAVGIFGSSSIDFADALALADARDCDVVLHTFDRKLARLPGASGLG